MSQIVTFRPSKPSKIQSFRGASPPGPLPKHPLGPSSNALMQAPFGSVLSKVVEKVKLKIWAYSPPASRPSTQVLHSTSQSGKGIYSLRNILHIALDTLLNHGMVIAETQPLSYKK